MKPLTCFERRLKNWAQLKPFKRSFWNVDVWLDYIGKVPRPFFSVYLRQNYVSANIRYCKKFEVKTIHLTASSFGGSGQTIVIKNTGPKEQTVFVDFSVEDLK